MDIFDTLALFGRRYERQREPRHGGTRFSLADVLEMFDRNAIFELTPASNGRTGEAVRPNAVTKIKVSLLDNGFSAIGAESSDWYEVLKTAPTGDLAKVRIVAFGVDDVRKGEIRMLIGPRSYDHYFRDDPILDHLNKHLASK